MKKIIFFLTIVLIVSSCKKENLSEYKDEISGEWEYIRSAALLGYTTPLPAGNGKIIVFEKNGLFERRSHDTVLFRGRYSLSKRKDCYGQEKYVFLNTNDNSFVNGYTISMRDDSLLISTPNCYQDGGTGIYRRL